MNRVTGISGLTKEGKSTELVEDYLISSRLEGINAVLVTCEDSVDSMLEKICKVDEITYSAEFREAVLSKVLEQHPVILASSADELIDAINDSVKKHDCIIYIDMPETVLVNYYEVINGWVDKYPNTMCSNSVDIVFTRARRKT